MDLNPNDITRQARDKTRACLVMSLGYVFFVYEKME